MMHRDKNDNLYLMHTFFNWCIASLTLRVDANRESLIEIPNREGNNTISLKSDWNKNIKYICFGSWPLILFSQMSNKSRVRMKVRAEERERGEREREEREKRRERERESERGERTRLWTCERGEWVGALIWKKTVHLPPSHQELYDQSLTHTHRLNHTTHPRTHARTHGRTHTHTQRGREERERERERERGEREREREREIERERERGERDRERQRETERDTEAYLVCIEIFK